MRKQDETSLLIERRGFMELMEAIRARKSYRNQFEDTPVPRNDLREILEAGVAAPSGCNMQTTQFIGVDDPVLVKRLAEIYGKEWALTAPAAILVLTKETMSPSGVSYHIHDYSAAMENLLLAITAKGYASVWVEGQIRGERAREMGRLLGVPEELTVAVYLPVGVPAKPMAEAVKKPFEERAWFNGYRKRS